MNLIDVFTGFCAQMTGQPKFTYKSKYEHNADDHQDYSDAVVNLIEIDQPGFKFNRTAGTLRDRFPVFIEFVKRSDRDLTAMQRNIIVQEMRMLAAEFIMLLDGSDLFEELPEIIPGVEIVDRYDSNTAGWEMNLILVAQRPMAICV